MEQFNRLSLEEKYSASYLGRVPVPITSSCQGLLRVIRDVRNDVPYTVAIIRSSVIEFTIKEEELKDRVVRGAEANHNFGCSILYHRALADFEKALSERMEQEVTFFGLRKEMNSKIYEILVQSPFPYSMNQARCLHRIRGVLDEASGDPTSEADKTIADSVKELVRLLQVDDHLSDTSPFRVVIRSTIPFHLNNMIEKLNPLYKEEGKRVIPGFVHPGNTINLAGHLVVWLSSLMGVNKLLAPHEHFHKGMCEIYEKLMRIFKLSGLRLTSNQEKAFQEIERETRNLYRSPRLSRYEGIEKAWKAFMDELGKAILSREMSLDENNEWEFALYGPVNMVIRDTNWRLVHLMPVATAHLLAFPLFNMGMVNMVTFVTERFLNLYPMR